MTKKAEVKETEKMDSIQDVILYVQSRVNVPKRRYNKHGGFHYRSCEDIIEAVTTLLNEVGATLQMEDEPVMVGDWHYIKTRVRVMMGDLNWTVSAYAREPMEQKGMNLSQVTCSASSYARKTALSGMFALDDNDEDTPPPKERITENQASEILAMIEEGLIDQAKFNSWLKRTMKVDHISELYAENYDMVIKQIDRSIKAKHS